MHRYGVIESPGVSIWRQAAQTASVVANITDHGFVETEFGLNLVPGLVSPSEYHDSTPTGVLENKEFE